MAATADTAVARDGGFEAAGVCDRIEEIIDVEPI